VTALATASGAVHHPRKERPPWGGRRRDAIHSGRAHERAEASMAGMGQEFKAFVMRGNVLDLAVGVVIGAAFGKIVSSFVGDILMPPIGVLLGGADVSQLAWTLKAAAGDKPAVVLGIGKFIQSAIDFVIIAFAIFLVVKAVNRMKREEPPPAPPGPSPTERLLTEIRDLLRPGR
jgi:large conductance mechanosensitive channel